MRIKPLQLHVFYKRDLKTYDLPARGSVCVGRLADCDVCIPYPAISRRHLLLHVSDRVEVEDLGSSNGTTLTRPLDDACDDAETNLGHRDQMLPAGERVELRIGEWLRVGAVMMSLELKRSEFVVENSTDDGPIAESRSMREVLGLASRAAASDMPVLIQGETGVGKEVVAEFIHRRSPRSGQPFLKLNCAALGDSLFESELFGHVQGAFDGAGSDHVGLLESSNGGTIFLDEIGELSLPLQAKLLRTLEERCVRRIGSNRPRAIDVRFIAATNRQLDKEVARGNFRKDLLFRINALKLEIAPLRQRRADLLPLAQRFLRLACATSGADLELDEESLFELESHFWPGNVRELRNVIERAALFSEEGKLKLNLGAERLMDEDGAEERTATQSRVLSMGDYRDERARIMEVLNACAGNQTRAASMLGVSRRTLVTKLDQYGLPRPRKARR